MCGRYRIKRTDMLESAFRATITPLFEEFSELKIHYSVSPGRPIPIVRAAGDGRELTTASWGFIPARTKEKPGFAPINAKSETVATGFMFKYAFNERRCLIPCDGFYEPKGPKTLKKRQAYFFRRPGDEPFALAGIWEPRSAVAAVETCTMLTTGPNAMMKPIHDRMPVVLHRDDWDRWLDPTVPGADVHKPLRPAPDDYLENWPVLDMVEDPEGNGGYRDGVPEEWR